MVLSSAGLCLLTRLFIQRWQGTGGGRTFAPPTLSFQRVNIIIPTLLFLCQLQLQIKYFYSMVRAPVQELRANWVAELVSGAVEGEERCPAVGTRVIGATFLLLLLSVPPLEHFCCCYCHQLMVVIRLTWHRQAFPCYLPWRPQRRRVASPLEGFQLFFFCLF